MSATNSTPIINLPLFIGTDKPAWLTDWNGAMNTIDTAIANLQTAEAGTATSLASLAQSVEALSGTVGQHTTAIQTVTNATAANTGSINTINSLIGNGKPTTTDKTIIGAINEIYADIGGGDGVDADEVNYDNTSSGLTASNVQAAIDELAQGGGASVDADDVVYSNTASGLAATNVQDAIDEVAKKGDLVEVANGDATTGLGLTIPSGYSLSDFAKFYVYGNDTANSTLFYLTTALNVAGTYDGSFIVADNPTALMMASSVVSTTDVVTTIKVAGGLTGITTIKVYGELK